MNESITSSSGDRQHHHALEHRCVALERHCVKLPLPKAGPKPRMHRQLRKRSQLQRPRQSSHFFLRRKELERAAVARKPPPRAAPCLSRKLSRPTMKPRCRRWSKPVKMPALMRAGGCWQRSRTPPLMTSASARPSSQRSRPRAPPTCTVNFAAVLQKDAERGETYPAWSKESLTCTRRQAAGTMLPPSLWLEWETYP